MQKNIDEFMKFKVEMEEEGSQLLEGIVTLYKKDITKIRNLPKELTLKSKSSKFKVEEINIDSLATLAIVKNTIQDLLFQTLPKLQSLIFIRLMKINDEVTRVEDYNKFSKETRELLEEAYSFTKKAIKICNIPLLDKENRVNTKLLQKLEEIESAFTLFDKEANAAQKQYDNKDKDYLKQYAQLKNELLLRKIPHLYTQFSLLENTHFTLHTRKPLLENNLLTDNKTTKDLYSVILKSTVELLHEMILSLNSHTVQVIYLVENGKDFNSYSDNERYILMNAYKLTKVVENLCMERIITSTSQINHAVIERINTTIDFLENLDVIEQEIGNEFPSGILLSKY